MLAAKLPSTTTLIERLIALGAVACLLVGVALVLRPFVSRRQAHDCAKGSGTVQAANPGDHAKGQGRQHQNDNGRAGFVYAGLARLFRLLRNA